MRDAWVLRLLGKQFFQDRARLLAVGKRCVVVRLGCQQRQRVESRRFVILRILLVHLLHGGGVSLGSRFVVRLLAVGIERLQGLDVIAFAFSWGLHLVSLLQLGRGALDGSLFRLVPELIPQAHRLTPVRHGALRVLLFVNKKSLLRLFIPERMQQRDTLFEGLLRVGSARYWEMHRAQLLLCEFLVTMTFVGGHCAGEYRSNTQSPNQFVHGPPPEGV